MVWISLTGLHFQILFHPNHKNLFSHPSQVYISMHDLFGFMYHGFCQEKLHNNSRKPVLYHLGIP